MLIIDSKRDLRGLRLTLSEDIRLSSTFFEGLSVVKRNLLVEYIILQTLCSVERVGDARFLEDQIDGPMIGVRFRVKMLVLDKRFKISSTADLVRLLSHFVNIVREGEYIYIARFNHSIAKVPIEFVDANDACRIHFSTEVLCISEHNHTKSGFVATWANFDGSNIYEPDDYRRRKSVEPLVFMRFDSDYPNVIVEHFVFNHWKFWSLVFRGSSKHFKA